jgi:hypothetical protein
VAFNLGQFDIREELVILEAGLHRLGQITESAHDQMKLI